MFPCQLKIVQDNNKRLQEYNASLQLYNSNLQADALQNGETISRLQNEKSAIMENLSGLRDHINSLKSQLDSSRVSLIIVFLFCHAFDVEFYICGSNEFRCLFAWLYHTVGCYLMLACMRACVCVLWNTYGFSLKSILNLVILWAKHDAPYLIKIFILMFYFNTYSSCRHVVMAEGVISFFFNCKSFALDQP